MKSIRLAVSALIVAGLAIVNPASATVTRQIGVAGAFVPNKADQAFWDNTSGAATVVDGANINAYHYGFTTIPIESGPASFPNVSAELTTTGGSAGASQVCYALYTMGRTGSLSAFTGSTCSSGSATHIQVLSNSLSVGNGDAVLVNIAAQHNGKAKYLDFTY